MEQNLTFDVIDILLKDSLHAREIAKRLEMNHMTTLRRMRSLMKENVLDARQEGRNKVYFIKKTIEARNLVLMTELFKLNKLLKRYPKLRRIVHQIQQNKKVKLAVLYGSYAKGNANKNSDVDVFIETTSRGLREEIERIDSRLSVKIGPYANRVPLLREIEKNHVIIKAVENYYEEIGYFD